MLGDQMLDVVKTSMAADRTYLFVVRYDVIEGQAQFRHKMSLVPSVGSQLHRALKQTVHQQYQKADKVRYHRSAQNPELEKLEQEKRTQEVARLRPATIG
ncbi:hypothetical protein MNEG_15968 [Monoraphidium neglectum]|uniref:Uncharacterized protein n=1 Tax=Monoraphidium neglectum TaxID=145388 RepID=A0A0D2M998_9CHLO|nr:hypothetical protein MNEG_15968 [Monoraphidium neglectum]KIY91995.1 hypothetical protein MNEG_15968 [Monoraphidium neglectum]|eukprot:XP_013891015.1 hypothetical protein MNEG_15968 [Monoraphidium neglectum]